MSGWRGKAWKYGRILLPALLLAGAVALQLLSRSAAAIFNYAMERQGMLQGSVTVEELSADMMGRVSFVNLEWKDPQGRRILLVPDGSFRVRLWDVLTRSFKSTTVQELALEGAEVSLHLDEDMRLDFVPNSPEFRRAEKAMEKPGSEWAQKANQSDEARKQAREEGRLRQRRRMEEQWSNFDRAGRKLRLKLELDRCRLEVFFRDRHYLLSNVQLHADINTDKQVRIDARTGIFGGTMVGGGMMLRGTVDCTKKPVPECSLLVLLQDVDPASLGIGMKLHDKMTLSAEFQGPVSHPVGNGQLRMEELHIPGLDFSQVEGKIHYEDATLRFEDVEAEVYGGRLAASGEYDMDTRHYHIHGKGTGLRTRKALPGEHLACEVDLDLDIASKGSAKSTIAKGSFVSGPGSYYFWVTFDSISGKFSNAYRDLQFQDVLIDLGTHQVRTDALRILNKQVMLDPINLVDAQGRTILTYDQQLE